MFPALPASLLLCQTMWLCTEHVRVPVPVHVCCRAQAQNNEATLAETLQKTTSQVSSELVELCCENHALSCENHELMRVRQGRG